MLIKTCPFCGGRPYIEESQRGFVNGESTRVCFVRCRNCNARSPRLDLKEFGHTSRSSEAINIVVDAWNQRTETADFVNVKTSTDRKHEKYDKPQQAALKNPSESSSFPAP